MTKNDLMAWLPLGAGVAFGVAIGAATDNMGVWLAVGVAAGMGMTTAFWRNRGDT